VARRCLLRRLHRGQPRCRRLRGAAVGRRWSGEEDNPTPSLTGQAHLTRTHKSGVRRELDTLH
jgi:hypothetical protein